MNLINNQDVPFAIKFDLHSSVKKICTHVLITLPLLLVVFENTILICRGLSRYHQLNKEFMYALCMDITFFPLRTTELIFETETEVLHKNFEIA